MKIFPISMLASRIIFLIALGTVHRYGHNVGFVGDVQRSCSNHPNIAFRFFNRAHPSPKVVRFLVWAVALTPTGTCFRSRAFRKRHLENILLSHFWEIGFWSLNYKISTEDVQSLILLVFAWNEAFRGLLAIFILYNQLMIYILATLHCVRFSWL